MEVTNPIHRPLADEHVIGIDPPLRPELPGVWRRRINAFAGRALSDKAMTAEQDLRAGMQRLRGLAVATGCVEGLALTAEAGAIGQGPDAAWLRIAPGIGISRSGEDVALAAARRLRIGSLPVILRTADADKLEGEDAPAPRAGGGSGSGETDLAGSLTARLRPEAPRRLYRSLADLAGHAESAALPHVGVIVAQPVTATILGRPVDQCPPDPRDDPYADLQRIDGCRLAIYLWPAEMTAIDGGPDYSLPPAGPGWRNRLAYRVFDNEKLLLPGEAHPWEAWGVPLAIAGFAADWSLAFVDRHAVARIGGTPLPRTPAVPMTGDARLHQARLDQFVGHLTDLPVLDETTLRNALNRMPPVGVLPAALFDMVLHRQHFFPASFRVSAIPVPQSNLDMALQEAAGLASFNRGVPDRVELLIPVPDAAYEPGLLQIAKEDPRFAQAVAAFRADRTAWLSRREVARRRYDHLLEAVSGSVGSWPAVDLPLEENTPAPRVQTPVEVSRTRRFSEASAARTHAMTGAHATLTVANSDTIWFWLRIHRVSQMTGLSLRLSLREGGRRDFSAGVFWGEAAAMPIAGEANGLAARRIGDLPEEGVWHRLEVPAAAIWTAAGGALAGSIDGVEFTQRGGDVEWGSMGKITADGRVATYIADDAPAGAALTVSGQQQAGWPWLTVEGRDVSDVPEFGTISADGIRRVAAIDSFRANWPQPFLAADLTDIDEGGIAAFLREVEGRLKATNDAIDLGFVRARADIYRVRQIMLGADAASRLVTSPSLADLAARDEGARATSKGISEYLTDALKRKATDTILSGAPAVTPTPAPTPSPTPSTSQPNLTLLGSFMPQMMTLNIAAPAPAPAPAPSPAAVPLATGSLRAAMLAETPSFFAPAAFTTTTALSTATLTLPTATPVATPAQTASLQPAIGLNIARLGLDNFRYQPKDIQAQIPVAGLVERTVSVAERLTPPPAVQAHNYALASKAAVIGTLSGLVGGASGRPKGVALGDIALPGFRHKNRKPEDAGYVPTVDELIADRRKASADQVYVDADVLPSNTDAKHEADYFTAAVQAIDNSVAIMRLVEGRVAMFETLVQETRELRDAVLGLASDAAAYLRRVDVEVEEARHDLSTAQRLRIEEATRVAAINTRRGAVLGQVQAIAWRRVREAAHRRPARTVEVSSGLAENPVVVCRREHDDVPEEVHDYVELMRDAPVNWFPALAAQVARIERLEAARAAIEAMRARAALPVQRFASTAPASKLQRGVQSALEARRTLVQDRRSWIAQINLAALPTLSLQQTHVQLRETANVGDLIEGQHRQPALSRMAAAELDGIATIAGCLHESFGEVVPAIRLGWAEILSEFDRPAPLRTLSGLPGWPDIPLDLRRALQGFVDYLFARIDPAQQDAADAMNELVRIAMLMAAHAPVDRIIPARLVDPVPARIGARLRLALDISRIRKGMTTLVRDAEDRILSRAVVEDIADGHAVVAVVEHYAAVTTYTPAMRFQLMGGTR